MKLFWSNFVIKIIQGLNPYFHDDYTQLKWGDRKVVYNQTVVGIEGLARSLWSLAFYCYKNDKVAIPVQKFLEKVFLGLKNGTNTQHKYYWDLKKLHSQVFVEMAAIANFMLWNPQIIDRYFNPEEKENLGNWLRQINFAELHQNNWQFFYVLVNLALKQNNLAYDQTKIDSAFVTIEKCYLGNGWYCDGRINQKDYYIAFGYHFYALIYAFFSQDSDPLRSKLFVQRALEFYESFKYFFDLEGRTIPYGRSLIYKFAPSGFLGMLIHFVQDVERLKEIKYLITQNLIYWKDQTQLLDAKNLLTLGYVYPNENFLEEYNSNTSPYWMMKGLAFLSLEANHLFWKIIPVIPKYDAEKLISPLNSVIITNLKAHLLINSGQWAKFNPLHNCEKYTKFFYSSSHGFNVIADLQNYQHLNADSLLVFEIDNEFVFKTVNETAELISPNQNQNNHWALKIQACYGSVITVLTTIKPLNKTGIISVEFEITSKINCTAYFASLPFKVNLAAWQKLLGAQKIIQPLFWWKPSSGTSYEIANTKQSNLVHEYTKIIYTKTPIQPGIQTWRFEIDFKTLLKK